MEIIRTFGINPILIIAEIINFLVILYILKRFLYQPIFAILKKREKTIQEGIKKTEESRKLLEEAKEKEASIISKANVKADKIISDAKNEAFNIISQATTSAKKQSEVMLQEAQIQILNEGKLAEKRLFAKIGTVMQDFVEQAANDLFDKKMQERILENALKKFKQKYQQV